MSAAKKRHQISAASDQAAGLGGRVDGLQPIAMEEHRWGERSKEGGLYQLDYLAGLEEIEIADRI